MLQKRKQDIVNYKKQSRINCFSCFFIHSLSRFLQFYIQPSSRTHYCFLLLHLVQVLLLLHIPLQLIFVLNFNVAIRIDNAASIGIYDTKANKVYGINYKPYESFTFSGITLWNNLVMYAMRGNSNKKPKLYFYNPDKNIMTDSIDMGFNDYGRIYIQQNILTGFANNRIYSYDLKKGKLLWNYTFNNNSIGSSCLLHNGKWVVNTNNKMPAELSNVIALPFNNFHEANNILYCISAKYLLRINLNQ